MDHTQNIIFYDLNFNFTEVDHKRLILNTMKANGADRIVAD